MFIAATVSLSILPQGGAEVKDSTQVLHTFKVFNHGNVLTLHPGYSLFSKDSVTQCNLLLRDSFSGLWVKVKHVPGV